MRNTKAEITQVARRMFARSGYDGVSTRAIAAEVGISVATLNYHSGGKANLYKMVFQDAFVEDDELITTFCETISDSTLNDPDLLRDALLQLVDDHIDLLNRYQEAPRLWLRRWLAEPDSPIAQIDVDFGKHLYQSIRDVLRRAEAAGTLTRPFNMRYFLMSITWMEYGFFSGGSLGTTAKSPETPTDESIGQFKTHMHLFVCNMLGLPLSAELQADAINSNPLATLFQNLD